MLAALLFNTSDAVCFKDRAGRYRMVNSAGARRHGRTSEEIVGRDDAALWPADVADVLIETDRRIMHGDAPRRGEEKVTMHGGARRYLVTRAACCDETGAIVGLIELARDITDRKQAEDLIRALSFSDELTGLRNRGGFTTLAGAAMAVAHRDGRAAWLFYMELGNGKDIRERLGHREGDQALQDAAHILRGAFRVSDIVARVDNERFAVLVLDDATGEERWLQRLRRGIEEHRRAIRRGYSLVLNIGAVRYDPTLHATIDALLADAEITLYRSKEVQSA